MLSKVDEVSLALPSYLRLGSLVQAPTSSHVVRQGRYSRTSFSFIFPILLIDYHGRNCIDVGCSTTPLFCYSFDDQEQKEYITDINHWPNTYRGRHRIV